MSKTRQIYYAIPITQNEYQVMQQIKKLDLINKGIDISDIEIEGLLYDDIEDILDTLYDKGILEYEKERYILSNISDSETKYFKIEDYIMIDLTKD